MHVSRTNRTEPQDSASLGPVLELARTQSQRIEIGRTERPNAETSRRSEQLFLSCNATRPTPQRANPPTRQPHGRRPGAHVRATRAATKQQRAGGRWGTLGARSFRDTTCAEPAQSLHQLHRANRFGQQARCLGDREPSRRGGQQKPAAASTKPAEKHHWAWPAGGSAAASAW